MISISDIYWLAGYLEGEGYFGVGKANGARSKSLAFKISVGSTDRDVVERASRIMSGIVRLHSNGNGIRDGYARKRLYDFTIHGSRAIQWMMTLYPLMGTRRKERIGEVISAWKNYENTYNLKGTRRGSRVSKILRKASEVLDA